MSQGHSRIPGWVWITTPAMALGFAAFVVYLTTVPSGNELDAVRGDAKSALQQGMDKIKQEAVKQVAPPDYEFYRLLEKQSVNVDDIKAYKSTPKGAKPKYVYTLQVGSFRQESQASRLRAELILEGLNAYQSSSANKGSTWYRVMVGPFYDRSKLNKAQDILASRNLSPLVHKKILNNP